MSDLNDLPLQQILVNNFNAILDKNEKNLYHIEQLQIQIYPGMRWEFINLNILGNGIISLITLLFNTLSKQNRQTLFQNSHLLSLISKESFTEDDALLFLQKNYSHIGFGNISIKKSDTIQPKVNLRDELYILHGLKTGEFEIGTEDFVIDNNNPHLDGYLEPTITDMEKYEYESRIDFGANDYLYELEQDKNQINIELMDENLYPIITTEEEYAYREKLSGKDYFYEIAKNEISPYLPHEPEEIRTSLEIEKKIIKLIKQHSSLELIEKELHNLKISILQEANNLIKFNNNNK